MSALTRQERILYHQVHPLKLITDWGMAMLAAWLLWQHRLVLGLATGFIPSAVVTIPLTQFADLDRLKHTALGRYVAVHNGGTGRASRHFSITRGSMTHAMEATRLAGLVIFWVGAWARQLWLLPVGVAVVLAGWVHGVWHCSTKRVS
jgi:hypothetical protein